MPPPVPAADDLAHRVDAFEEAVAADPDADLDAYLSRPTARTTCRCWPS